MNTIISSPKEEDIIHMHIFWKFVLVELGVPSLHREYYGTL